MKPRLQSRTQHQQRTSKCRSWTCPTTQLVRSGCTQLGFYPRILHCSQSTGLSYSGFLGLPLVQSAIIRSAATSQIALRNKVIPSVNVLSGGRRPIFAVNFASDWADWIWVGSRYLFSLLVAVFFNLFF